MINLGASKRFLKQLKEVVCRNLILIINERHCDYLNVDTKHGQNDIKTICFEKIKYEGMMQPTLMKHDKQEERRGWIPSGQRCAIQKYRRTRYRFLKEGEPVISVDTKKKVIVRNSVDKSQDIVEKQSQNLC